MVQALLLPDREQVKFSGWWGRSTAEFLNARAFISPHALDSWRPSKLHSNSLSTRHWTLFPFPSFFFPPHCSTQDASSSAWLKHHNPFGLRKLWNWQVIKISQCPNIKTDFFVSIPHENCRMNCFEKEKWCNGGQLDRLTSQLHSDSLYEKRNSCMQ